MKTFSRVVFVIVFLWAAAATYALFVRNPLPFPDKGSCTFAVPGRNEQYAIIKALRLAGVEPRFRINSGGVERAFLWNSTFLTVTPPTIHEKMGNPVAGMSIVVDDPAAAARAAQLSLQDSGYRATVITDFDPGTPPGSLVGLSSNAFPGWVLVYRWTTFKIGGGERPPSWDE